MRRQGRSRLWIYYNGTVIDSCCGTVANAARYSGDIRFPLHKGEVFTKGCAEIQCQQSALFFLNVTQTDWDFTKMAKKNPTNFPSYFKMTL